MPPAKPYPPEPTELTKQASEIYSQLAFWTGCGAGAAMGATPFDIEPKAMDFWLRKHTRSIHWAIDHPKGPKTDWGKTKAGAERAAANLGRIAARLALRDTNDPDQTVVIRLKHVKEASEQVRDDRICRRARVKGMGVYCAID